MEEFPLVKDFAIMMVTAGTIAFICNRLRLSPVFGYLIAGILISPYTFSSAPIDNVNEVQLLADLGLVLLLFGIGLEFNWGSIRQVGLTLLLIAGVQTLIMFYLGYCLGQLMGWENWDSIFLGSALSVTSSAIVVSTISDLERWDRMSTKMIIGISVAEDFAAIAIIAILTGMARSGVNDLDFGEAGIILLKLVTFIIGTVAIGTLLVPKIIKMIHQTGSKEVFLVTCLGLCFGGALLSREMELSVATGAFLMGALLGNIDQSEEITETIKPIHHMFGALYFVAIGMLVDVSRAHEFIGPALIITTFFIVGKIVCNTLLTYVAGFKPRSAWEVGIGMPQMGEFSLAIAKIGKQYQVVRPTLYPAIAVSSAFIALTSPWLIRYSDAVADLVERRSPALLKGYVSRLSQWLQELRMMMSFKGDNARIAQKAIRTIVINILIVMAVVGIGTVTLPRVENIEAFSDTSDQIVGFVFSIGLLTLCLPSFMAIWRGICSLDDAVITQLLGDHRQPNGKSRHEAVRIIVRDSIFISLLVFAIVWSFPLVSKLFALGSLAITAPLVLLAVTMFLTFQFIRRIHRKLEETLSRTILGDDDSEKND